MTEILDSAHAARLGAELHSLSERLAAVSSEFAALTATPAGSAAPAPPAPPVPAPPPTVGPRAMPYPPRPAYPPPPYARVPQGRPVRPPVPPPPSTPPTPLSERLAAAAERGLVGRVLAAVGVGITLIGVVLLLILAAQAGLLRPEIRVAGGVLFAFALIGAGAYIGRREAKRSGAVALVATGIATALFDVLAAATIYHWLPVVAALLLGAAIAAGGFWFAHRWNSQALGLMVSVPLLVFAPIVADGVDETLIAFLLVYAGATLWLQVGRDWTSLFIVNTAATTLPLLIAVTPLVTIPGWFLATALVLNVALAVGSAVLLIPTSRVKELVALTSAGSAVALLGAGPALDQPLASVAPAVGAALLAVAAFGTAAHRGIPLAARAIWVTTAAVLSALAVGFAVDPTFLVPAGLATALVVTVAALFAGDLRRVLLTVGSIGTAAGLIALVHDHGLEQLLVRTELPTDVRVGIVLAVILGLLVTTLLTWAWDREFLANADRLWIAGGLVDLALVTALCVTVAALATGGSVDGFRAGHTVATLIWFGTAAAALLWARRLTGSTRTVALTAGLALIAAAVAKLFLFDLAALAGFLRVIAFLVAGILLLVLGVAYAQSLAGDPESAEAPKEPTAIAPM